MRKNILIVDDSRFMQQMILRYIKEIDKIDKIFMTDKIDIIMRTVTNEEIDIMILDIVLDGFSGIDVIDTVKKIDPYIKVVMCSSMGQKELIREALEKGACDFIIKPFTKDDLKLRIHNVLLK